MNGQYLMRLLNQFMKKNNQGIFAADETKSRWHKETDVEILQNFCREVYPREKKYGHFIIGNSQEKSYIGIPGRFILKEQPHRRLYGYMLMDTERSLEND